MKILRMTRIFATVLIVLVLLFVWVAIVPLIVLASLVSGALLTKHPSKNTRVPSKNEAGLE